MISVIINFYNNQREAKNTLYSLSRMHQQNCDDIEYEVIVLDHGSKFCLSEKEVTDLGKEFKYFFIENAPSSPVKAINRACKDALGNQLIILIDGAHIVTPNILKLSNEAYKLFDSPFIATPAFHLGPKSQNESISEGYNQKQEDILLEKCSWHANGYNLFNITNAFADAGHGWFGNLYESSCFGISKEDFIRLGGLHEGFKSPGGGLVGLDFFRVAMLDKNLKYVMLLGEATFHQVHGGIASNAKKDSHPWGKFHEEFMAIRGCEFKRIYKEPFYIGKVSTQSLPALSTSADLALEDHQKRY